LGGLWALDLGKRIAINKTNKNMKKYNILQNCGRGNFSMTNKNIQTNNKTYVWAWQLCQVCGRQS